MKQSFRENLIVVAALCGFAVYLALGIMHHEAWRDEWQAINIARAATSLPDLYGRLRYESHPALWYLCIRAVWEIFPSILLVQILNSCFALAAAGLIAFLAPWPLWLRLMIAFTGPTVWEYSVKVRSYGLGWLIIVILALVLRRTESRLQGWLVVLLTLLALNTSIFTGFIAFSLLAGWLWEKLRTKRVKSIIPQITALLAATLGTLWLMLPSTDSLIGSQLFGKPSVVVASQTSKSADFSSIISQAKTFCFLLFPQVSLDGALFPVILFFMCTVILYCFISLCANPSARIALACGWLSIFGFLCLSELNYPWHHWHLFLVPIAVAIAFEHRTPIPRATLLLLAVIAAVGLNNGVTEYIRDWKMPYSAAQKTAQSISAAGLDNLPIVVSPGPHLTSLSGYLGRPLYDDSCRGESTYTVWRTKSKKESYSFDCAIRLAKTNPMHKCLVTFNTPLPRESIIKLTSKSTVSISFLGSYLADDSSTYKLFSTKESYYVYILTDTYL